MREQILKSIYSALDDLEAQSGIASPSRSPELTLFGQGGFLDSLGLVNLIALTEQRLADDIGTPIMIADEKAFSQRNSPFRSVDTLANYILTLLN